ncbi:restriction endonuclease subunit S [Haloquadratum walsbyi]|uniref:Type I site-specific deoxyribonuclease subunit RmeS n=1 Tax=Haloquadratum walsbyi (strain DSM 16854 / JCM 12705 / C23) TaxID=768065 RepID=G0LND6_HALWC|nr:restriction endonuclease subunit S [Haloquadratum walsbyi]CCC41942.1 type I site-specific deoxyribonuclease subunit RmeS [Haloquadratum walsbyi C23]
MSEDITLDKFTEATASQERQETPIGELPVDWDVEWLKDAVGINPDGFSEDDWSSETFEYISLSEASNGEIENSKTIPITDAPSRAQRTVQQGDVLVGTVRPKQKSHGFVSEEHAGKICSSGFGVLRTETHFNSRYLLQEILSNRFFSQMEAYVAGSGYPAVKISDLKKHRISIPPLVEQRKIATVLHTIDQAIQKTEEIIQGLQTARKGLTQQLLRSGFEDEANLVSTRSGPISFEIPSHWNVVTIDNITDNIYRYPTYQNIDYVDEGVPEVRIGMLDGEGYIERGDEKYISESTSEEYPRTQLEHGDTVMAVRGATLGKTASVPEWLDGGNINPNLIRICSNDEVLDRYLTELFLSGLVQRQIEAFSQQTTVKTIKSGDIRRIAAPIPPVTEQERIMDILSSFSSRIQNDDSYLSRLQRLKSGLMQDLLSGKVRTTNTNIEIPEEVITYG